MEEWCSLNVRHIQWDTLVYLVLPTAARSCHATAASELCSSAATLYQENERDVPEQIVNAYKHNYSNVLDFVHLQTKLRQSYGKLHVSRHDVAALAFGPPGFLVVASAFSLRTGPGDRGAGRAERQSWPRTSLRAAAC